MPGAETRAPVVTVLLKLRDQEMLVPIAVWELICIVATLKGWDPRQVEGAVSASSLKKPLKVWPPCLPASFCS